MRVFSHLIRLLHSGEVFYILSFLWEREVSQLLLRLKEEVVVGVLEQISMDSCGLLPCSVHTPLWPAEAQN